MSYQVQTLLSICFLCSLPYSKAMAVDMVNCSLDTGCDISSLTKKTISEVNNNNRLSSADSNKSFALNIDKKSNRAQVVAFSNATLKHNQTIALIGDKNINQSFVFGPLSGSDYGSNVTFDLNDIIISEAAFYQSVNKSGKSSIIDVNDMWVLDDSGIVSYYSKEDDTFGGKMNIDNVHVERDGIFNVTLYANNYILNPSSGQKFDVNIGNIETGANATVNFMGIHSNNASAFFSIDIGIYDGKAYANMFNKSALNLKESTLYLGSDIGIDKSTQKWGNYEEYGYPYVGDALANIYISSRFMIDKDFNWDNKVLDNDSKIYFYNSDFKEASVVGDDNGATTVNANELILVKNNFYGNNTFNATQYDIYDAQFYRKDDNGAFLVDANDAQQFNSLRTASVNLHYSLSLKDYDSTNFVGLNFDNASVHIKGDNNVFKLNVDNVTFNSEQVQFVKTVDDILDSTKQATDYEHKTAIITADNIAIDTNTQVLINNKDYISNSSTEKAYIQNDSYNVTYNVQDGFSIAANADNQSLYYVTNALGFTMHNDATLNLDTNGSEKYLNHLIYSQGEGQKDINILNSQNIKGSVEFTNKIIIGADFSVDANTSLKLGLDNATGDSGYTITLKDSNDPDQASILDLNGFNLNVTDVLIELGNNSIIAADDNYVNPFSLSSNGANGTSSFTSTNNALNIFGTGEASIGLKLNSGDTAAILVDTTLHAATVELGYDNKPGTAALIIGDGNKPVSFNVSGSYNNSTVPLDQAHMHIGDANVIVKDNSSFAFGPNAAIHIGTDQFGEDDYKYDIDNENNNTGGALIQIAPQGEVKITLNSEQGSHIYVNSLIGLNSLKYLFSGTGEAIDPNNKVIDRITFVIDGVEYKNISTLSAVEIDNLEAKIDSIINQQFGNHIKLQDISIEMRDDGIFLASENIENVVQIIFPNLDNDSVIDDVLKLKTDDTADFTDSSVSKTENTQAYNYISKLIDNTIKIENQENYGSDLITETVSENIDHIAQLVTANRLQYMSNLALDNITTTVTNRGYNRLIWDKQVDLGSNLWVDTFYMNAKINKGQSFNHNLRSNIDLQGVLVGYDRYLNDDLLIGAAIGYNTGKSTNYQNSALSPELEGEIDNYLAVLYGSYKPYEHLLMQADLIYMMGNGTASLSDNNFAMQDFNTEVDINSYSFDAKFFAPFNVYDNLVLAPFVGGSMSLITTDKYDVLTNNSFYSSNKSDDIFIYYAELGLNVQGSFKLSPNVTLHPSLDLSYINYYGDINFKTTIDYQDEILGSDVNIGFLKDDSAYNGRFACKLVYKNMDFDLYASYLDSKSYENLTLGARFNISL